MEIIETPLNDPSYQPFMGALAQVATEAGHALMHGMLQRVGTLPAGLEMYLGYGGDDTEMLCLCATTRGLGYPFAIMPLTKHAQDVMQEGCKGEHTNFGPFWSCAQKQTLVNPICHFCVWREQFIDNAFKCILATVLEIESIHRSGQ